MNRIFLAGLLGGLLMFFCGAFAHMALELESRSMKTLPKEGGVIEAVEKLHLGSGFYSFPGMQAESNLTPEQLKSYQEEYVAQYRKGPAGILLVVPAGEDPMGPRQLLGELLCNVGAATIAAWVVSQFAVSIGFFRRWLAVVLLAPLSWLSLTASHHLWYRFPAEFALDGLWCALLEWAFAGVAIVWLTLRKSSPESSPQFKQ